MLPKGFIVNGLHSGIAKKKGKKDLAVFFSTVPATAAGMFTGNLVKAAPVIVSRRRLAADARSIRAVIVNSGNANACTGARGLTDAETMCGLAARELGVEPSGVLAASTGVIGQFLPMPALEQGIPALCDEIRNGGSDPRSAVAAIMTTDTFPKVAVRTLFLGRRKVTVWGCAKGSGMIHPALELPHATMLSFILTDAAISAPLLTAALAGAAARSFNCVTVDGDTSTNDSVFLLANGAAGNAAVRKKDAGFGKFARALEGVCTDLAKMIARDGEGATKLVVVEVRNARDERSAHQVASTIATSPLVKTAIFGNDANWGRIICAAGYSGVAIDPQRVDIRLGPLTVARRGMAAAFSEKKAKKLLEGKEITITVDLHQGKAKSVYYTCDFSFDYVKINASYRT